MTAEWCSRKPYREDETSTYQKYLSEGVPSHETGLSAFSVHKQVNSINYSASSSININSRKLWPYQVLRIIVQQKSTLKRELHFSPPRNKKAEIQISCEESEYIT